MSEKFWFAAQIYSILHFVIILFFLAHILRARKPPSSTLAWVFLVLIQPLLGLSLYIVFGSRKIRSVSESWPQSLDSSFLNDPIQKLLIASGSEFPCNNTSIQILENGEVAYREITEKIQNAGKSIYVETFIFSKDEVGKNILELLTMKAKEGLDVRILIDAFGTILSRNPSFKEFQKAGGKFAKFMPIIHKPFRGRANLRNHRKLILIDHTYAIMGGMNIASEYMGPHADGDRWLDLGLIAQGPLVTQMEKIFREDWSFATHEEVTEAVAYPEPVSSSAHIAQLVSSGPDNPFDPIYEWLLTALYIARKRIWITTPYFIPDESLAKALELAAKRGVEVRLLIPARSNHLLADMGRTTYLEQVQSAGVKIHLFPGMIHAKLILIDQDYGLISSANLDSRSLLINYELGVCLYSAEDIRQLEEWCLKLFRLCQVGIPHVGPLHAFIGGFARLISPLI